MRCLCVGLVCLSLCLRAEGQLPEISPPPGIAISEADRTSLLDACRRLESDIDAFLTVADTPASITARLADVLIFPKAVRWAVEFNEVYDEKEIGFAKTLLAEGAARLDAMRDGRMPWTSATGPVVRGFRSRIDGSVQPYGVVVSPDRPESGGRLDVFLHGRSDKNTELAFIHARMKFRTPISPAGSVVVEPYGRFCNGFRFAGETDVLEAVDDAIEQYGIDPDHVGLRGMSMGGAGVYQLGAHHMTRWAALGPAAGFVETAVHGKPYAAGRPPPSAAEQILWRLYDVPGYAANFTNRPVVAFSGEKDPQRRAAETMLQAIEAAGGTMTHLVAPNTGHAYDKPTKAEQDRLIDAAVVQGRPRDPSRVRFATYTLRYDSLDWVQVTGLEKHWERASVDAWRKRAGELTVTTTNVAALHLRPDGATAGSAWNVHLDGDVLAVTAQDTGLSFHKNAGQWVEGPAPERGGLRKQHGLQGPIDDAFMDRFVFVRPTGRSAHAAVDAWVKAEYERATQEWRRTFRGVAPVIDDTAVTPELASRANLILWGDPRSNAVLATILPKLPVQWTEQSLTVSGTAYPAGTHMPVLIYPNPLATGRYVVLNSCYTFRRGSGQSNALMTPKLPDWAVIDITTPPNRDAPGRIALEGFFDEHWQHPAAP